MLQIFTYLGDLTLDLVIATYDDGRKWSVYSKHNSCKHIPLRNDYGSMSEAEEVVRKLFPKSCQKHVKFIPQT